MPIFEIGQAVDLLDGGEVVAKANITVTDPDGLLHGTRLPAGCYGVSVVLVLRRDIYLPYPQPNADMNILGDALGSYIAWPRTSTAVCMVFSICKS